MHFLFKGVIIAFGLYLASCNPVPPCPAVKQEDAKQAEAALADFAINLLKSVSAKDEDKNQVLSPVSIALALTLLENGANGKTRDDIRKILVQSHPEVDVLKTYMSLEEQLRADSHEGKTKLTIANALFKETDLKLKDEYLQSIRDCFNGKVDDADFHYQLEQTRQKINRWVSEQTANKIPELFKEGVLQEEDLLVLANAIYFNASWQTAFKKGKSDAFYRNGHDQDKQTVQYIEHTAQHRIVSTNDVDALELDYSERKYAMVVVLPKQRDGLRNLEKRLTGKQLQDIFSKLEETKVRVQLPSFTIRSHLDLKQTLVDLGLESLFSTKANFSRMSETELKVGAAVHEAYIKVNENGTEAAAATGVSMKLRSMPIAPIDPISFVADHPFLYAVVHKQTGAIIFLGKVNSVDQNDI